MFDLFSIDQIYILYSPLNGSIPVNACKDVYELLRVGQTSKRLRKTFKIIKWSRFQVQKGLSFDEKKFKGGQTQKDLQHAYLTSKKNSESQHFHTFWVTLYFWVKMTKSFIDESIALEDSQQWKFFANDKPSKIFSITKIAIFISTWLFSALALC